MEPSSLGQGQVVKLLMQHRTPIYGYIFACVRNHDDAEDILQMVSAAVAESIQQLADEAEFLPWAREIARRRILAHRRRTGRELVLDPELVQRLADAAALVEKDRDPSAHRIALLACLETLTPEYRQIIALRYEGSCDANDLAATTGRSLQAVYALVKRIKQILRACVERRLRAEGLQA